MDGSRDHLVETYRRKARRYDIAARFAPVPGYPVQAQRRAAIRALGLRPGATVVDVACGTGLNLPLIEQAIGPAGRIVGVDLTDAMLAGARQRIEAHGWRNVSLVHADAADFEFPSRVDAILSTYAMSQVTEAAAVIARGAAALSAGGRWVVLDLKLPDRTPHWLTRLGVATVGRSNALEEWIARRPWDAIRAAMQEELDDLSWAELVFGTAFLAAGTARDREGPAPA
jgi:ubiquinone/menaquinone biosynthesis C-methylase UbiE